MFVQFIVIRYIFIDIQYQLGYIQTSFRDGHRDMGNEKGKARLQDTGRGTGNPQREAYGRGKQRGIVMWPRTAAAERKP